MKKDITMKKIIGVGQRTCLELKHTSLWKKLFLTLVFLGLNSEAQIVSPRASQSPWRLEFSENYCENSAKEKHLWNSINFFAKSVINTFPAIPPEQLAYIKREEESSNVDRQINITRNPFYKIKDTLETVQNLDEISRDFIKHQNILSYVKKTEFIGRTMANVRSIPFDLEDAKQLSKNLESRGYQIDEKHLRDTYLALFTLRMTMISHLICYGEKNIKVQ
jgi:hypothetical protein